MSADTDATQAKQPRCWLDDDGGFWWDHECDSEKGRWAKANGFRSAHRLPLGGDHGWTLVQVDPLTIAPSILCGECGLHGFWRDGQWVPA